MENFWSILLWIMAGFCLLFGLGLMPLSVQGGAVTLVGAFLMVPPISDRAGRVIGRLWLPPIVGFIVATMVGPIVTFATAISLEEVLARSPLL